jgi:hypothetical protein
MNPLYIVIISALVCFILYVIDRRMKEEPIDWLTAMKLSSIGSLIAGGVSYSVGTEEIAEVVEKVVESVKPELSQEMFVGVPTF